MADLSEEQKAAIRAYVEQVMVPHLWERLVSDVVERLHKRAEAAFPADLTAWITRCGLTHREAGVVLNCSSQAVGLWCRGERRCRDEAGARRAMTRFEQAKARVE